MLEFAVDIVNGIDAISPVGSDTRFAVYTYSNKVEEIVAFGDNNNAQEATTKINNAEYIGSHTRMNYAINIGKQALEDNKRQNARQIMIIFSDGKPQDPVSSTARGETIENVNRNLAEVMRTASVYMVGVNNASQSILDAVNNNVNGTSARADAFNNLIEYPDEVIRDLNIVTCVALNRKI